MKILIGAKINESLHETCSLLFWVFFLVWTTKAVSFGLEEEVVGSCEFYVLHNIDKTKHLFTNSLDPPNYFLYKQLPEFFGYFLEEGYSFYRNHS